MTINAAVQDVRLLSFSFYRTVDYITERLSALAEQIKRINADIVCVQELFHHDLQRRFRALLENHYPYAAGFTDRGIKFRLDNELIFLSKYPLINSEFNKFRQAAFEERLFISRGMYRAIIEIPNAGKLQLVNFHMTAGGLGKHPESQAMERIRSAQIRQLLDHVSGELPTILAGDLNAGPEASAANYEEVIQAGYQDAFLACNGSGITWDPANPLVAAGSESHLPPQRIDHVFLDAGAAGLLTPHTSRVVMDHHCVAVANGKSVPVSDHYGVRVDFEFNQNQQEVLKIKFPPP